MTSTSASAADGLDLLSSPSQSTTFTDSPGPRDGSSIPLKASDRTVHIPGISQDLETKPHQISESHGRVIPTATHGRPAEAKQKRKWEDDSVQPLKDDHYSSSGKKIEQIGEPITKNHGIASTHDGVLSSTGADEKRLRLDGPLPETLKKEKPSSPSFALPAQIWQNIFCYVPPVFLGRLLLVNHAFHDNLAHGNISKDLPTLPGSTLQPMEVEDIWIASRRRFCPGLPRPLQGLTELTMWRLLRGSSCQLCGKSNTAGGPSYTDNPLENRSGENGTRLIWPFGVRSCRSCLNDVSMTEEDLSLSSDCPWFLSKGIPFAYVTEGNHVVGHSIVRDSAVPPTMRLTKHYYKPHVETIRGQFHDVKELGKAAAQEWIKGLIQRGHQSVEDAIRWEQWEAKGGLRKVNARPQPRRPTPVVTHVEDKGTSPPNQTESPPERPPLLERPLPQNLTLQTRSGADQMSPIPPKPVESVVVSTNDIRSYQPSWNGFNPFPAQVQYGQTTPIHYPKPERNIRDIIEAKAARRADIERRCGALDPPIPPNVLNHMDSFQAALQISQPMTDPAWQVLKPRLLSQLPFAQQREKQRAQEARFVEKCKYRRQQETQLKEARDGVDPDWEILQVPIRSRLEALADNVIATRWAMGKGITKETTPKFAADVLVQVRQRFYADAGKKNEATIAAGGTLKIDPPSGPPVQTLILENMKWVFDNKVKPVTDKFQRELFLCSGCDGNVKFYGFEGVIQHYAAKHTTQLSMGNVVVHWRAEWPEHPPFHPNPSPAKIAHYKVPTPAIPSTHSVSPVEVQGDHTPDVVPGLQSNTIQNSTSHGPTEHGITPADKPQPVLEHVEILPAHSQSSITGESTYKPISVPAGLLGIHVGNPGFPDHYSMAQQSQSSMAFGSIPVGTYTHMNIPPPFSTGAQVFPQDSSPGTATSRPPALYSAPHHHRVLDAQPRRIMPPQQSELYKGQLEEMARHAKEVFSGIGGVKDIPGSVRIFVTIQHMVSRYKATFANEPSLLMFTDGLDHNATMRPVRSVNGLACKTCVISGTATGIDPQQHGVVVGNRRLYTLPHLVNHFKTAHTGNPQVSESSQSGTQVLHDWKHDMIELPDPPVVLSLATVPGMTNTKLSLISAVLPGVFAHPEPLWHGALTPGSRPMDRPDFNRPQSQAPPSEPPGDDEYDPHRPAVLQTTTIEHASNMSEPHAQPSEPQYGQYASLQVRRDGMRHAISDNSDFDASFCQNSSREGLGNGNSTSHQSSLSGVAPPPLKAQYVYVPDRLESERSTEQPFPSRQGPLKHTKHLNDPSVNHLYVPGYKRESEGPPPRDHGQQFIEPMEGEDRSLSELGPGPRTSTHKLMMVNYETSGGPGPRWPQEAPDKRQPSYVSADAERDDWRQQADPIRCETNASSNHISQRSAITVELQDTYVQPISMLRPHYQEEHYLSSRMQIPLETADGYPPIADFPSESRDIHARYQRSDNLHYQVARTPQYRSRSRSPHRQALETALYRTRSPVEEDRGKPIYQSRAVSSRRSQGTERVMGYEYPQQERYEYFGGRNGEPQYQARVEYLPVGVEELPSRDLPRDHSRYISQTGDHIAETQYICYEPGNAAEPLYEVGGQLVPAGQRQYVESLPSRAPASLSQEYRY